MSPRISWAPDGRRVLISNGGLRIASLDGTTLREIVPREIRLGAAPRDNHEPESLVTAAFLDGHWQRDGRIATIDLFGIVQQLTMHGEPYGTPAMPPNPWRVDHAAISEDGSRHVECDTSSLRVNDAAGRHVWTLVQPKKWYGVTIDLRYPALSSTGRYLALACRHDGNDAKPGWIVLDLAPKPYELSGSWRAPVVARGMGVISEIRFDRGTRLLVRTSLDAGVFRFADEIAARPAGPDARCAAIDDRGVRAVYGFAGSELRIDYLATGRSGPGLVEVIDQHRIDAGLEPIALAIEPEGGRIACLAADGRVEIVPVP